MSKSALAALDPETALLSYGFMLMNPAPKIPGLSVNLGGFDCPQGSVGVEVSGRWWIIKPGETLSIHHAHPDAVTIVDHFQSKYGIHSARDMGIRILDWAKIAGLETKEEVLAYVAELDIDGKEKFFTTVKAIISENLESANKARKDAGKAAREMDAYETRLWKIADEVEKSLGKRGELTVEKEAALIEEHAGKLAPPTINIEQMSHGQRLRRAKEMGLRIRPGVSGPDLLKTIMEAEAAAQNPAGSSQPQE